MGKLVVKNGTPVGNVHLCRACSWGQFMIGYRESDVLVICTNASPNIVVPFTMLECSGFDDKYRPDWKQMEKLAIDIQPVRVSQKTAGFSTANPHGPAINGEAEEENEAVLAGN